MQVLSPPDGRFHEGQEFLLVYRIVEFVLIELPGHTDEDAQQFLVVLLTEHGSFSGIRGVGVQDVRRFYVRECEDDVTQEALLQLLEGSLLCGSPVPDFLSG